MSLGAMNQFENVEDILSESLEFLGGEQVVDDGRFNYGPLSLTVPPKASIMRYCREIEYQTSHRLAVFGKYRKEK